MDPPKVKGIRRILGIEQGVDSHVFSHTALCDDVEGVYQQLLVFAILAHACSSSLDCVRRVYSGSAMRHSALCASGTLLFLGVHVALKIL